ncbi:hypothetical protein [Catelliglobosispora koreensis]|uniref:hypothetical protein n=1 Tax=Catelliglobosispora koreensis TaxID=129052 RepID=UPI00035E4AE1|nr:hypothetical protein [Catelliglobosispora koreensis]
MSRSLNSKLIYGVIGAVFLATVVYVLAVLPGRSARPSEAAPSPSPVAHSDGLTDSFSGYLMRAVTLPSQRGKAVPIAFQIFGPDGIPLEKYQTVQTKQLHLYLIRDDLSGYQHLHPELGEAIWKTTADIADGGSYRLFAEFTPEGWDALHPVILGLNFIITGDTQVRPLPAPAASATVDGHVVSRLDGTTHLKVNEGALLRFAVTGGTLEPYLGAAAHLSAFEVRTGALAHLHPGTEEIAFHTQFANRGEYRLFLEFQSGGKVHEAAFTIFVT